MAEYGLPSLDRDGSTNSSAASIASVGDGDFSRDLKNGMCVLLHVKVGKLEPASIRLDEESKKLIIKTNREGWRAMCYCHNRCYELGPGEMEPVPKRSHTRLLNRSVSVISGGDAHLIKGALQRSVSLIRRHPKPESIDLTFPTAELEERVRAWVQQRLVVDHAEVFRQSSRHVLKALEGRSPSDVSDDPTETATVTTDEKQGSDRRMPPPTDLSKAAPVYPARGASIPRLRSSYSHRDMRRNEEPTGDQRAYPASEPGGDADSETWKEPPPVLRRMETPPVLRLGKGGSRRASRSYSERSSPGSSSSAAALPRLGEDETSREASGEAASGEAASSEPREATSTSAPLDFWDPLNLLGGESKVMTPVTPKTPMSSSSATRAGAQQQAPNWSTPKSARRGSRSARSDNSE